MADSIDVVLVTLSRHNPHITRVFKFCRNLLREVYARMVVISAPQKLLSFYLILTYQYCWFWYVK